MPKSGAHETQQDREPAALARLRASGSTVDAGPLAACGGALPLRLAFARPG